MRQHLRIKSRLAGGRDFSHPGTGHRTDRSQTNRPQTGLPRSRTDLLEYILMSNNATLTAQQATAPRRYDWKTSLKRLVRLKLFIPMIRNAHAPEFTARGVAVGVFWAMTPTFGIQMALVLGHWIASRRLFNWDFSLVNGLAWTWITNAFTIIPAYYLFYLTGLLILGRYGDISGYTAFGANIAAAIDANASFLTQVQQGFAALWSDIGWPILIGSIPWAIASALLSYHAALGFIRRYHEQRQARIARKQARTARTVHV